MGKSLTNLLSDLTEENESDTSHALSKMVKCGNCGRRLPTPGTHIDVLCWNCKVRDDVNNDIVTSGFYNFQRDKIKIKRKSDRIVPAIHKTDHFDKTVDDRT